MYMPAASRSRSVGSTIARKPQDAIGSEENDGTLRGRPNGFPFTPALT